MIKAIAYAYIASDPLILNGTPIIEGTRTPIRSIAGYYNMGNTIPEILDALPHLSLSQVYSALAFYFDHKEMIDEDIHENQDEERWKAYAALVRPPS